MAISSFPDLCRYYICILAAFLPCLSPMFNFPGRLSFKSLLDHDGLSNPVLRRSHTLGLLLILQILHDLIHQNPRKYGSIACIAGAGMIPCTVCWDLRPSHSGIAAPSGVIISAFCCRRVLAFGASWCWECWRLGVWCGALCDGA